MKTLDSITMGWLGAQLHLVDAAQKTLHEASLAQQTATSAEGEPARLDELRKVISMAVSDYVVAKMDLVEIVCQALSVPADDPFAPLIATLTEYSHIDSLSRDRRQIDFNTNSFDANGTLSSLHIGYV